MWLPLSPTLSPLVPRGEREKTDPVMFNLRFMESLHGLLPRIGTMNRRADGPRPQHAATKGRVERSTAPADSRAADAERPRAGSWEARLRHCIGVGVELRGRQGFASSHD